MPLYYSEEVWCRRHNEGPRPARFKGEYCVTSLKLRDWLLSLVIVFDLRGSKVWWPCILAHAHARTQERVRAHTHTHTDARIRARTQERTYRHASSTHACVRTHTPARKHARKTNARTQTHIRTHARTRKHTGTRTHAHARTHARKLKITWNNVFSDKPKHKNSQIK